MAMMLVAVAPDVRSADLVFEPGEDARFSWGSLSEFAAKHELSGETLSVVGPWLGNDRSIFESVIAYFERATGAEVNYVGAVDLERRIVTDARSGRDPHVAVFPQPGLAAEFAARGYLKPLEEGMDDWVEANYVSGETWVRLASFFDRRSEKQLFGLFYKIDLKGLVWYIPERFEEAGYAVPESPAELSALSERIVADGGTPWCIGLDAGPASGWPATDWVENIFLHREGPRLYDAWVANEIPFDDFRVVAAIEEFGRFVRTEGFVDGGLASTLSTHFRESPAGLFGSPPACYMHYGSSSLPSYFPGSVDVGADVDFFSWPVSNEDEGDGATVLGAGTLVTVLKDTEAARAFVEFLSTPLAHEIWMAQSGFLSPSKSANLDTYANELLRDQGERLLGASTVRFDGSDLMPGRIGTQAFWGGMVDYVTGTSAQAVAGEIQRVWVGMQ